jgi:hypothetical protein
MFRRCFAAICLVAVWAPVAGAQSRCVPLSEGVPGTTTWQHAPNWWNAALGFPLYDTRIDAPSWVRATANSHPFNGNGSVEDMQFRALHRSEGGTEYLYLSWYAKTVPDLNTLGNNLVWFGVQGVNGGTTGVAIKIQLDSTSALTDALLTAQNTPAYQVQIRVFDGTNWGPYTPGAGAAATPRWINGTANPATDGTARVWIDTTLNRWGVNMRIPMSPAATNTNLDTGINLGSNFKFWYEARISTPNAPNGNGYVPYKWPTNVPDMDPVTDSPTNPGGAQPWETVRLSNSGTFDPPDPNCSSVGVYIRAEDIGSDDPNDATRIHLSSSNTLHANPHNGTASQVNGIKARFRMANWGTNPTWEDVPNPTSTLWMDIADANGVPQPNGISILANSAGNITTTYNVASTCEKCMYSTYYNANTNTCNASCGANNPATNNTRRDHQCLLVDLTGAGVVFTQASAYRNMNYAATSTFTQAAEINIKDLPGFAGGRDVYLYLQQLNMPAYATPGASGVGNIPIPGWPPPTTDTPSAPGRPSPTDVAGVGLASAPPAGQMQTKAKQTISQLSMAVAASRLSYEQLALSMPTLIVRAYYDTGIKNTAGGGSRPILKPLTSFGYFVVHDGDVEGWKAKLDGAQLIAPNWYRVAVPASGVATVTTVIEAVEFLKYSIGARAGLGVPLGSFGSAVDAGFAFEGDFEYRVNKQFAVQAVAGQSRFDAPVDNVSVTYFSARAKAYAPLANPRVAVFAGVGRYIFDPGDSHNGVNVGGVVEFRVAPQWSVEATYTLHNVSTPNNSTRFNTFHGGLRYRF